MADGRLNRLRPALTAVLAAAVAVAVATADLPAVDRAEAIGSRIRCPSCAAESIAGSTSGLAADMMALVRRRVDEGYSDDQIVDELLAAYSDAQLLDPPLSAGTLALWALPALALVAGSALVVSRRRRPTSAPEVLPAGLRPGPERP
jgi:cytochrome c-type biogenesis protein CcmH